MGCGEPLGSAQAATYVMRTSEAAQPAHGFQSRRLFLTRVRLAYASGRRRKTPGKLGHRPHGVAGSNAGSPTPLFNCLFKQPVTIRRVCSFESCACDGGCIGRHDLEYEVRGVRAVPRGGERSDPVRARRILSVSRRSDPTARHRPAAGSWLGAPSK